MSARTGRPPRRSPTGHSKTTAAVGPGIMPGGAGRAARGAAGGRGGEGEHRRVARSAPVGRGGDGELGRVAQGAAGGRGGDGPHRRVGRGAPVGRGGDGELGRGAWLWLCRAGFEADLIEEIVAAGGAATRLATGLVVSPKRLQRHGKALELAFARQGLKVTGLVAGDDAAALGRAAATMIQPLLSPAAPARELARQVALHVIVPDSDEGNPLASYAAAVEAAVDAELLRRDPSLGGRRVLAHEATSGGDLLVQVCVLARGRAAVSVLPVGQAPSLAPGGRRRISAPPGSPSRAAAKLLEAFDWLGRAPDAGDLCVDLGAAPGGWSHVLLTRKARVIAIDPARLAPHLARHRHMRHLATSAFLYRPERIMEEIGGPADWLCCDMAWRPLEVAALLARWGRQGAARFLVANIKLPMKKKVEMIGRLREILETGGWRELRVRQLYHDRDEITLGAFRLVA